jgi:predicted esterase
MAEEPAGFKHRFVAGSGQDGATLPLLHGTGGNENDLLSLGRELLPGDAGAEIEVRWQRTGHGRAGEVVEEANRWLFRAVQLH